MLILYGYAKYHQPRLLCTPQNLFAQTSKFVVKNVFGTEAHKRNFELVDETLIFQGHLNVFWGSFTALLCSSRWSDQKFCKIECVALKNKLSNKTNVSSLNPFSCTIPIFEVRVKVSYFKKTNLWKSLTIFHGKAMAMTAMNMVSAGGFLGGKFSFKKMSAGGRLCTLQENPHFWVLTIKVRPPDGIWPSSILHQNYLSTKGYQQVMCSCIDVDGRVLKSKWAGNKNSSSIHVVRSDNDLARIRCYRKRAFS